MSSVVIGVSDVEIMLTKEHNESINKSIDEFVSKLRTKKQSTNYYVDNRNANEEKAAQDIFLGKKAEYMTALALHKKFNLPLLNPDLEIRDGTSKGWEVDLPYASIDPKLSNIHVKS